MDRKLRILVADDDSDIRQYYAELFPRMGHELVAAAVDGQELVELSATHQPDLILTDIRMPVMDGIEASAEVYRQRPIPIIVVSGYFDPELIERAAAQHIMAYLVKPVERAALESQIDVSLGRFQELRELEVEIASCRKALEDRKVIEQAKRILMQNAGLSESDAFRRLQRLSGAKNLKMVDIAGMIILAEQALVPA